MRGFCFNIYFHDRLHYDIFITEEGCVTTVQNRIYQYGVISDSYNSYPFHFYDFCTFRFAERPQFRNFASGGRRGGGRGRFLGGPNGGSNYNSEYQQEPDFGAFRGKRDPYDGYGELEKSC